MFTLVISLQIAVTLFYNIKQASNYIMDKDIINTAASNFIIPHLTSLICGIEFTWT